MKKLLCIFTLLTLVSVSVYAEPKKDMKTDFTNFTEEQIQNVSNSVKDNSVMAQELKTLLNEKASELEESATSPQNPTFTQTRLKTFFDHDAYGVKKYAETSNALLETYNSKCREGSINSTDDITWDVEKTHSSSPISSLRYDGVKHDSYRLFFNEYDFAIECPNGNVYIAYKLCFTTAKYEYTKGSEKVYEYVNCGLYRANINGR